MFVPEELPTDLMLGALQQKQKQYDIADAAMIELGNWNERALENFDTNYVKGWKSKIEDFANKYQGTDLTSPDFIRNYREFNKQFKNDEGLQKVRAAVAKDDAFWLRWNALKQDKDTYAAANELANDYLTRRAKYTAVGGLGFSGDVQLGDENIKTGNDLDALAKKLYDDMKANGSDAVNQFKDFSYKTGYEGVSQKRLDQRSEDMLDHFIKGPGGQQLIDRYNMEQFGTEVPSIYLQNMSKQEREQYDVNAKNYVLKYLKEASGEFQYSKTTTNLDEAKNNQGALERSVIQQPNIEVDGLAVDRGEANYATTFGEVDAEGNVKPGLLTEYRSNVRNSQHNINLQDQLIKAVNAGKPIAFSPEQKTMLQGLPGGENFMNGKGVTADQKKSILDYLNNAQTAELVKLQDNKVRVQEIEANYAQAVDMSTGGTRYNGLTFKEAHDNITEIENDPNMKQVLAVYSTINAQDPKNALKVFHNSIIAMGEENKKHPNPKMVGVIKNATKYYNSLLAKESYFKEVQTSENSAEKMKDVEKNYESMSKQYTPKAQVAQFNEYTQFDENGRIKGKAKTADTIMQEMLNNNLSQFVVMDTYTGEIIPPTIQVNGVVQPNPEYPDPSSIVLASVDKEPYRDMKDGRLTGTKIGLNVSAMESKYSTIKLDGKKEPQTVKGAVQRNYKIIAQGVATKTYTEAKRVENMSNYYANPNTATGKQSYIDAQMFSDPDYYKELSKVNNAPVGKTTLMNVKFYSPDLLKEVPYTIETEKIGNDGNIIAVLKDHNNKNVTEKLKFNSIDDFNNYIKTIRQDSEVRVKEAINNGYTGNSAEILKDRVDEEDIYMKLYNSFNYGIEQGIRSGKITPVKITNAEGTVTGKFRTKAQLEQAEKSSKDFEKKQDKKFVRKR